MPSNDSTSTPNGDLVLPASVNDKILLAFTAGINTDSIIREIAQLGQDPTDYNKLDVTQSSLEGNGLSKTYLNELATITLKLKDKDGKPFTQFNTTNEDSNSNSNNSKRTNANKNNLSVSLVFRDAKTNQIVDTPYRVDKVLGSNDNVGREMEGVYEIQYTMNVLGKFTIDITIDGIPLLGSPFQMYCTRRGKL